MDKLIMDIKYNGLDDMCRVINNALRGRRKTTDTSVSCESIINGLGQLPNDTTVDVVYYERDPYNDSHPEDFFRGTPEEVARCLESKFLTPSRDSSHLYCDGRYRVFSGRSGEKHYIHVQYGYTSAGLSEADSFRLEPFKEIHLSYPMPAGCRRRQFVPLLFE
ncbi:MAG: hypothetical protein HZB66_03545 [Candidatus Aenigmarchaeota archaeon]|nr:hypothetical protein [Candidatus Aenigmarchaeota archaeon]